MFFALGNVNHESNNRGREESVEKKQQIRLIMVRSKVGGAA